MARKCTNCSWEGETASGPLEHCPVCGDNTEESYSEIKKEALGAVVKPTTESDEEFILKEEAKTKKRGRK